MEKSTINLSRLTQVNLRNIFITEDRDFTPWLAREENLALLGETIGFDLELEAQEKDVGPFRADILCKDTATNHWVLIENQLERTDHRHLGQLITYAAGLRAVTIIWIANPFTDEHRAALDWLNEISDSRFNFFGLEIELWRIDDSLEAPKFNIVCKPNDWSKTVAASTSQIESGELSENKQLQRQFWHGFRESVLSQNLRIRPTKPLPQHWMNIAIGRSGFKLCAIASLWDSVNDSWDSNELRAELVLSGEDSKSHFVQLEEQKAEIESELGHSLVWYNPENAKQCRIYIRRSANIRDSSKWPEQYEWLSSRLEHLHQVFQPLIKAL